MESVLRECGLVNVEVDVTPLSQHSPFSTLTSKAFQVVSGTKEAPAGCN